MNKENTPEDFDNADHANPILKESSESNNGRREDERYGRYIGGLLCLMISYVPGVGALIALFLFLLVIFILLDTLLLILGLLSPSAAKEHTTNPDDSIEKIFFVRQIINRSEIKLDSRKNILKNFGLEIIGLVAYCVCLVWIKNIAPLLLIPVIILLLLGLVKPSLLKTNSRSMILKYLGPLTILLYMGASGFLNSSAPTTNNTANNQNADVQNKAGVNKEEPQQSQAPAPEPAKQEEPKPVNRNITVTNTIIKKVDGKCRYFFTIRNEDKTDFSGSVYIGLLTTNTVGIAGELFDSTEPIQPESGDSVYFDRVTCPTNAGGNAAGYSFEVKENNQVVNSGKNNLTDKFENLDIYK